jgi:hypothetical protein
VPPSDSCIMFNCIAIISRTVLSNSGDTDASCLVLLSEEMATVFPD